MTDRIPDSGSEHPEFFATHTHIDTGTDYQIFWSGYHGRWRLRSRAIEIELTSLRMRKLRSKVCH